MSSFPLMPLVAAIAAFAEVAWLENRADVTNLTTYSFSSVDFGSAQADRYIIVGIGYGSTTSDARSVSSVTIGGVSASQLTGYSGSNGAALWIAAVPTGTSGTVAITMSGTCANLGISAYRVAGLGSTTPVAAYSAQTSSVTTSGSALATSAGGFVIAMLTHRDDANACSWVGVVKDFDAAASDGASTRRLSSGHASKLGNAASRTIEATTANSTTHGIAIVSMR
jgi:hypothetical protein